MAASLVITVLVDDPQAWIVPYAQELVAALTGMHDAALVFDAAEVREGDMLFLLGCTQIVNADVLARNRNNFVVHESDLPRGRGWSPLSWQVEAGAAEIPVCLFEAVEELDAGPVWLRDVIRLDGTELLDELKAKQGRKTVQMVLDLVARWPELEPEEQRGEPTFYPRRTDEDNRLDPEASLAENFDRLRTADNDRFPAWFTHRGCTYQVKIYKK